VKEVLTDQWVVKLRSVVFSTRRKHGHRVAFYEILTLGAHSIAKKRNLSNQNNLVILPPFSKLSDKFQRNWLPNVQDIKFFSVRPPPKFCLINLFMSSLSPAALIAVRENIALFHIFSSIWITERFSNAITTGAKHEMNQSEIETNINNKF